MLGPIVAHLDIKKGPGCQPHLWIDDDLNDPARVGGWTRSHASSFLQHHGHHAGNTIIRLCHQSPVIIPYTVYSTVAQVLHVLQKNQHFSLLLAAFKQTCIRPVIYQANGTMYGSP